VIHTLASLAAMAVFLLGLGLLLGGLS